MLPPVITAFMSIVLPLVAPPGKPKKLLEQVRDVMRLKH
jgi:hypothetical protein